MFFFYLSSSIYYYHEIQKNQENDFIFECMRKKLFLYGFIVTTLFVYVMHKYGVCILYGVCGTQRLVPPRGLEKA